MREQNRRCFEEGGVDVECGLIAQKFAKNCGLDDFVDEFEGILEEVVQHE